MPIVELIELPCFKDPQRIVIRFDDGTNRVMTIQEAQTISDQLDDILERMYWSKEGETK